jgi:sialate O-acetylesterase
VFARDDSWLPGVIFNARVAPVAPYAIRGALWYQAESNCGTGEDPRFYRLKMAALIAGWRSAWERPDLPLYFVQLPQYNSPNWVWMRDEQRRAMVGPGVGMAVTIDLAPDGIHPANKIDVGERLALWPLGTVYGKPVPFSGPLFASADRNGSSIIVHFTHADGGLVRAHMVDLKPAEILVGDQIAGVEVCGQDRVWHPAGARIDHDALVCTCDQVPLLIGVRYAWASLCPGADGWNLANRSGLPASPFISDPALVAFALDQ